MATIYMFSLSSFSCCTCWRQKTEQLVWPCRAFLTFLGYFLSECSKGCSAKEGEQWSRRWQQGRQGPWPRCAVLQYPKKKEKQGWTWQPGSANSSMIARQVHSSVADPRSARNSDQQGKVRASKAQSQPRHCSGQNQQRGSVYLRMVFSILFYF